MSWKRSKDGGLDYDTTNETAYRKAINKLFGNDDVDERPKASWVVVHPEVANELEPKLSLKNKLKQRIKEGSLRE